MSIHSRIEDNLRELEKLLRDADTELDQAYRGDKVAARKRRTGINAACNALHRATKA